MKDDETETSCKTLLLQQESVINNIMDKNNCYCYTCCNNNKNSRLNLKNTNTISTPSNNIILLSAATKLPCSVFALQIMSFLPRAEVKKIFWWEEIGHHQFQLDKYYCGKHGTLLQKYKEEYSAAPRTGRAFPVGNCAAKQETVKQEHDHQRKKEKEDSMLPPKLVCEDCIQEDRGLKRCPECELFSKEDSVISCQNCNRTSCSDCWSHFGEASDGSENSDNNYNNHSLCRSCDICKAFYCGNCNPDDDDVDSEGCRQINYCYQCDGEFCLSCDPMMKKCAKCQTPHGCSECPPPSPLNDRIAFTCHACHQIFCRGCQNHYVCGGCRQVYCHDNKDCLSQEDPFLCHCCNENFCKICTQTQHCGACGNRICHLCTFQCAICGDLSCWNDKCNDDGKVYKCPQCSKLVCSDCQEVFSTCCCCCHEKATFEQVSLSLVEMVYAADADGYPRTRWVIESKGKLIPVRP